MCGAGKTCKENKCQSRPMQPVGVKDGSPLCVLMGRECCGVGYVCNENQVCENGKCIEKSECAPVVAPDTCWTCAMAGIKGYFDGCNSCGCDENGVATCTEKACILSEADPKMCAQQCDGFRTEDDGTCGRCTCVNGVKTKCSNAGTEKCTDDNKPRDIAETKSSSAAQMAMMSTVWISISASAVIVYRESIQIGSH
jgi:hypothetical protein